VTPVLPRPIGGFFERHQTTGPVKGPSLLEAWTAGRPYAAFTNARSAFAALIAQLEPGTVWLPAYVCPVMVSPEWRIEFYEVGPGFTPNLSRVETEAEAGDLLLLVAFFGQPIDAETEAVVARRADLHVVEDRAQALDAGPGADGRWLLYSPRKLLGVADGGLLVAPDALANPPHPEPIDKDLVEAFWRASDLRAADPDGRDNARWHAANQVKEATMAVARASISPASLSILDETGVASLSEPRLRNWEALDARLQPWSALPADPSAPPLGYVLDLEPEDRERLRARLISARVFPAVHWPELASPPEDFPREHVWTRRLLTLPCDHRYDAADMARIADLVAEVLR
jgi:dTDP-4-amino-4,6-dideoxygalactose transaminase